MKFLVLMMTLSLTGAALAETSMIDKAKGAIGTAKTTEGPTQLDDLIRGEMAAVRSYNQALVKVKDQKTAETLRSFKNDHQMAVETLRKFAGKDVKEDTNSAGVWGGFAETFTGAGSLMGNSMAMKAINVGEKHGVNEYEEALEDETIKPELKELIRNKLLPQQKKHIETLKSMQ